MDDTDVAVAAPRELSIEDYVEARAQEMLSMHRAASVIQGNRRPMQQLPHHMRRRAASHDPRRLPRTLREWAKREMAKAPPNKSKRPSRKHRRRPSNLTKEYARRQRKFVWLETHIWHAKRFHMTEKWGYKIPLHPNDKGARAAYRATTKYCLLQDVSYYCCIDIQGPEKSILLGLSGLTSPETGLTFAAKVYLNGTREGSLCLFHSYPTRVIGDVKFLWKPKGCEENCDSERQLWIWVHPAMYTDVMHALINVFDIPDEQGQLDPNRAESVQDTANSPNKSVSVIEERLSKNQQLCLKLKSRTRTHSKVSKSNVSTLDEESEIVQIPKFTNGVVTITSLKDSLCRFHLTGPLSTEVLLDVMKIADINDTRSNSCEVAGRDGKEMGVSDVTDTHQKGVQWWKKVYSCDCSGGQRCIQRHQHQAEFWESVRATESPGELQPHCVLGLTVRDPRVQLPQKRSMVSYDNKEMMMYSDSAEKRVTAEQSWSPLWDAEVRQEVMSTKIADGEMNTKRSEALVPGSELKLGDAESRVPVIVIQNPGQRLSAGQGPQISQHHLSCIGYSSGYDLIVPGGWGKAFLIALVYRGARVAGLKEMRTLSVEAGTFLYPDNYPDSDAGKQIEEEIWKEKQSKYDRMPPAKRPNYNKLGVAAPFYYPWQQLLHFWASGENVEYFGQMDSQSKQTAHVKDNILLDAEKTPEKPHNTDDDMHSPPNMHVLRNRSLLKKLHSLITQVVSKGGKQHTDLPPPSKVCKTETVSIHQVCSEVFTPEVLELHERCLVPVEITMIQKGAPEPFSMICLPDENDLKDFKKDRTYGGPIEPIHNDFSKCKKQDKTAKKKIVLLSQQGYPPKVPSNYQCCNRKIIGYVRDGSYSFARGHGFGLGFVALSGLRILIENSQNTAGGMNVLIRSATSLQYRFGCLSIHVA